MATILLNGVAFDTSAPTELNDKLTVSGGTDALDVNLLGGDDLIEVATQGENITSSKMDGGSGDDVITIELNGDDDDFTATSTISADSTIRGATGDDTITINDGNVIVEGLVNANDGDDTISVVRADGATIQGGAGEDEIHLGSVESLDQAGSRATNSINDTTIYSGKGDDTIRVQESAELTAGSTDGVGTGILNGGNDDDTIVIADGASIENYAVNGNKGNDVIIATGDNAYTNTTIFGGKGDDMLHVGGGVTAVGGLGADTFSIESAGGVTIEAFDKLDDEACFCDDAIQIDGNKIELDTYEYDINRVDYTSASSWMGNIKVKAVIDADDCPATVTVKYTATKTETLTATAVAFLKVTETKTDATTTTLPKISFPAKGRTQNGATFVNGLAGYDIANDDGDDLGGLGKGFASNTGYWLTKPNGGTSVGGTAFAPIATTTIKYAKGDYSFLQLTKTAKAGCTTTQKLVYDDVTRGTVTNHWASYLKEKDTLGAELYSLSFGTANFETEYTGKGFMIVTDGLEDKAYKSTTLEAVTVGATAKVTLTLNNDFEAWKVVPETAGQATPGYSRITSEALAGVPTDLTYSATGRFLTEGGKLVFNDSQANTTGGKIVKTGDATKATDFEALTVNQAFWSTLQNRGLLTLNVRAAAPATVTQKLTTINTSVIGNPAASNLTANITEVDRDIFATNIGKLAVKIKVQESDTAKASKSINTIVERTTFTNTVLPVSTCPEFPATPFGNGKNAPTNNRTGKHGDLVTAEGGTAFGKHLLWTNNGLQMDDYVLVDTLASSIDANGLTGEEAVKGLLSGTFKVASVSTRSGSPIRTSSFGTSTPTKKVAGTGTTTTTRTSGNFGNQGFFSGSDWKVSILAAAGMGNNVGITTNTAGVKGYEDVDGAPFRVLFFDTKGTDNGLYVYSGTANYEDGDVTAINTNPTGSSAMGGKHTIVKVTGGKGHEIALSDINFV